MAINAPITTRAANGTELTWQQMDGNLTSLQTGIASAGTQIDAFKAPTGSTLLGIGGGRTQADKNAELEAADTELQSKMTSNFVNQDAADAGFAAKTARIYGIEPIANRMSQPIIAGWDFRRVQTGAVFTTIVGAGRIAPMVADANVKEINGKGITVGLRKDKPLGAVKLPLSDDHRKVHYVVPAGSVDIAADDTAYALEFIITPQTNSVLHLHEFLVDLGYEQTLEGVAFNDFTFKAKFSTDNGVTWAQAGSDFTFGISAAVTKYAVTGSGGVYYWKHSVAFAISQNNVDNTYFSTGTTPIRIRLYISYNGGAYTTSIGRRVLVANARLEGATSKIATSLASNGIVYSQAGKFCGWPAGSGHMQWGDRMIVGFEMGDWASVPGDHDIDYNTIEERFSISDDGGETWSTISVPSIVPPDDVTSTVPSVSVDMRSPGFGMITRQNYKWWTTDFGNTWQGPSELSAYGWYWYARTSYDVLDSDTVLLFNTAKRTESTALSWQSTRYIPSVWKSVDGSKTWSFVGVIGAEDFWNDLPPEYVGEREMPRAFRKAPGHYLLAIRERRSSHQWIGIWETVNNFKTVSLLSRLAFDADNPPAMVVADNGDVFMFYCSRISGPKGLCMVRSQDGGRTWSIPVYLRTDALSWDMGYPVAFKREDGKLVVAYYYHTASNTYQHIARSIVDPNLVGDLPIMPEYNPLYPEQEEV